MKDPLASPKFQFQYYIFLDKGILYTQTFSDALKQVCVVLETVW